MSIIQFDFLIWNLCIKNNSFLPVLRLKLYGFANAITI